MVHRTSAQTAVLGGRLLSIIGSVLTLMGVLGFAWIDYGEHSNIICGMLLGFGLLIFLGGGFLQQQYYSQAKVDAANQIATTIPTCHTTAVVVTVSGNSSLLTSPTNAGYDQEIPPPETLQGFSANAHQSYGVAPPTYDMHGNPGAAVPQPGYGEDNLAFAQQPYEQPPPYGPPSDCTPAQMAPEFRDPTPQMK